MIGSRCGRNTQDGAGEGGGQFGDELLSGVTLIAETAREIPAEAVLGASPMR